MNIVACIVDLDQDLLCYSDKYFVNTSPDNQPFM